MKDFNDLTLNFISDIIYHEIEWLDNEGREVYEDRTDPLIEELCRFREWLDKG